jgi:hypothetical protein
MFDCLRHQAVRGLRRVPQNTRMGAEMAGLLFLAAVSETGVLRVQGQFRGRRLWLAKSRSCGQLEMQRPAVKIASAGLLQCVLHGDPSISTPRIPSSEATRSFSFGLASHSDVRDTSAFTYHR